MSDATPGPASEGAPAPRHPLPTVGALVVGPSARVLIVKTHKWRGLWGVPGGKIDHGETMRGALEREFSEETGLTLTHVYWAPVQEAVHHREFYKPAHFILLNFIATTENEAVTLNDEAEAYAWVAPERALTYDLNAPTRTLVEFYVAHRAHQPLEALPCLPR